MCAGVHLLYFIFYFFAVISAFGRLELRPTSLCVRIRISNVIQRWRRLHRAHTFLVRRMWCQEHTSCLGALGALGLSVSSGDASVFRGRVSLHRDAILFSHHKRERTHPSFVFRPFACLHCFLPSAQWFRPIQHAAFFHSFTPSFAFTYIHWRSYPPTVYTYKYTQSNKPFLRTPHTPPNTHTHTPPAQLPYCTIKTLFFSRATLPVSLTAKVLVFILPSLPFTKKEAFSPSVVAPKENAPGGLLFRLS